MKKIIAIMIALLLVAGALAGCAKDSSTKGSATVGSKKEQEATDKTEQDKTVKIVTTIFPEYDWIKQILGEQAKNAEITLLLNNGVDLHNYQPTAEDIVTIGACDLFVYVGGHSDGWVDDVLAQATNPKLVAVNLMELLGDEVKVEEIVEGMEHNHDHEHEEDHEHSEEEEHEDHDEHEHEEDHEHSESEEHADHDHDEHEHEEDEHVWLSLRNAQIICSELAAQLSVIDPANADIYKANAVNYCDELSLLDEEYGKAVKAAGTKTLLFGDRFPFRYLVDDYGIDYYAAFAGCSAESEASFETIAFLAKKVDELGLKAVMTIDGSDQKIAETILSTCESKDVQILSLNSLQTLTTKDAENGCSYLSAMIDNLEVLKKAL